MNLTALTWALDTLGFWLYNYYIQTGAHSENHNQSTKEAQRTHHPVLYRHTFPAEGCAEQDPIPSSTQTQRTRAMNERIDELWQEAVDATWIDNSKSAHEKFAELIVRECKENFGKVWYEQGLDIRGAEFGKFMTRFEEHFGVEK
jgi:hypothetical protein